MVKALFDTNILIDYLNGIIQAKEELERFEHRSISVITWMEVMAGTTPQTRASTEAFLSGLELLSLDDKVADRSVVIRQTKRLKLPDAIVWATAQIYGCILVTRNTKDMSADEPGVRVPYTI